MSVTAGMTGLVAVSVNDGARCAAEGHLILDQEEEQFCVTNEVKETIAGIGGARLLINGKGPSGTAKPIV